MQKAAIVDKNGHNWSNEGKSGQKRAKKDKSGKKMVKKWAKVDKIVY